MKPTQKVEARDGQRKDSDSISYGLDPARLKPPQEFLVARVYTFCLALSQFE